MHPLLHLALLLLPNHLPIQQPAMRLQFHSCPPIPHTQLLINCNLQPAPLFFLHLLIQTQRRPFGEDKLLLITITP